VLINKADGELLDHANRSAADYANALRLIRPRIAGWEVPVRAVSALTGTGIDAVWGDAARFRALLETNGAWARRRAEQARAALFTEIGDGLLAQFRAAPQVSARFADIEREVMAGTRTPADGARELLRSFLTEAAPHPARGERGDPRIA
jgi:LAO/AO transport system kinase